MDNLDLNMLPELLLPWYRENHRCLPWRETKEPYHIWLSEIMLQQTRVEAVKGYYARFLAALPTVEALDAAVERARTVAAPQNKQRFDSKTPCEVTGACADCKSDGCICNQILITRNCNPPGRIKFILVGEDLGL